MVVRLAQTLLLTSARAGLLGNYPLDIGAPAGWRRTQFCDCATDARSLLWFRQSSFCLRSGGNHIAARRRCQ